MRHTLRETPLLRERCNCGWKVPRQFAFTIHNDSDLPVKFRVSLEFACPECGSNDLLALRNEKEGTP